MKEFVRVLKFVFFSISAGLIEMGSFAILTEFTPLPYWIRYLVALILSIIWNFILNRKFTFQSNMDVKNGILKVFGFYLVFTPLSILLGNYLVEIGVNDYISTGICMLLNLITEFLYQRYLVFKDSLDTKPVKI